MGKHTPGPWRAKENGFSRVAVVDRDGNYLTYKAGTDRMPNPELEANANLIAAAPDLLEALENLMRIVANPDCAEGLALGSVRTKATAAIARARGEA